MTPAESHRLELLITEGFGAVRSDINLLARGEQEIGRRVIELEKDVGALKARNFPLPTIGCIMGVAGVCVSVVALVTGKG